MAIQPRYALFSFTSSYSNIMYSEMLTPAHSPENISSPTHQQQLATRSQRVLACVLCQQRKVKCDRKTPCNNCTKAGVQCVSAALVPRQRRRRFPERELLDRLRHYEELLRQNNIPFEPLHPDTSNNTSLQDAIYSRREPRAQDSPAEPQISDPTAIYKTK